jgi:hypothetical protein
MSNLILLSTINYLWYAFPLAAVVSLVYSASRYESPKTIIRRAGRLFVTIIIFMALVLGFLFVVQR